MEMEVPDYYSYKNELDDDFLANYTPRKSDTSIYRPNCPVCLSNDFVLPIRLGLVGPDHKEDTSKPPRISFVDYDQGYKWDCTKCMVYFAF